MSKPVQVDWGAFRALVVSGLSIREVARRLGVNPNTALQKAARENWGVAKLHGRGRKRNISPEALAITQRTIAVGQDFLREADGKTKFCLAKATVTASETLSKMDGPQLLDNHVALHSVAKTASHVFNWDANHPHPFLSIQGALFRLAPEELAAELNRGATLDDLLRSYSATHPVREMEP
jgi:transposase-like protein